MEYIQCESCHKKYGVNDKVRAAAGRSITCKACGKTFEITIFETPSQATENIDVHENEHQDNIKSESNKIKEQAPQHHNLESEGDEKLTKPQPQSDKTINHKKVLAKKLAPSVILGVAIIVLSFYFFYLDRHVDIGQSFVATQTPKPLINIPDMGSNQPITQDPKVNKKVETAIKIKKHQPRESLPESCKDVAARQWLNDFTMFHGTPNTDDFVRMLDEGNKNTALMRKRCGSNDIVQEVLDTAKDGEPPTWLVKHIRELTSQDEKLPHF